MSNDHTTYPINVMGSDSKNERTRLLGENEPPVALNSDWASVLVKNAQKRAQHATSNFETLIHLIKGNIGTGLLALPLATKDAGYIVGPIFMVILGIIATHCMVLLVDSSKALCEWNQIQALDYSETMLFAMKARGVNQKIAKTSQYIINIFLMMTQFGFCSVYFVFIGETLKQVMNTAFCIDLETKIWIAAAILPVILFSWIKNLDHLAPLSALANICILLGLCVIFYDEIFRFVTHGSTKAAVRTSTLKPYGSVLPIALFFGNAIFSFEAIGAVLPLENKMKTPQHAKWVIYVAMTLVTLLYTSFGLLGYLVYGDNIQASITLNLCATNAETSILFLMTKMLFAYSVFATYLLQFYVPLDFLEPPLYKRINLNNRPYIMQTLIQLGFRTFIVLVTAALALSIPDLGDLLTLVGALASSALALIFPPLIHLLTFWNDPTRKFCHCLPREVWAVKDIAIISVGIIGFSFGTFASIYSIIHYFEKPALKDVCSDGVFETYCHLVKY